MHIQKLAAIVLRHNRMGGAKIPGEALQIDLGWVLPAESIQFPAGCPPGCCLLGIFMAKFRCQIKGICRG